MDVTVLQYIDKPIVSIGESAGVSTHRENIEDYKSRVKRCFINGHTSVLEFAWLKFHIEGISRACSHQLVRHRLFSICQRSQRYTRVDVNSSDWFVIPKVYNDTPEHRAEYISRQKEAGKLYQLEISRGTKPEDARYLLPESTKTALDIGTNLRELFNFLDLREDPAAQWEIRDLAFEMDKKAGSINSQWEWLMGLRYNGRILENADEDTLMPGA